MGTWVAGRLRFELRLTESESAVLPLNDRPAGKKSIRERAAGCQGLKCRFLPGASRRELGAVHGLQDEDVGIREDAVFFFLSLPRIEDRVAGFLGMGHNPQRVHEFVAHDPELLAAGGLEVEVQYDVRLPDDSAA